MSVIYPFPLASHSYFRVVNQAEERTRFLASNTYQPNFIYVSELNTSRILKRLHQVEKDGKVITTGLRLALAGAELQKSPNKEKYGTFRALNQEFFNVPQKDYTHAILYKVNQLVKKDTQALWEYVVAKLSSDDLTKSIDMGPSHEVFCYYKDFLAHYTNDYFSKKEGTVIELLTDTLKVTGLQDKGWKVEILDDDSHARVHHQRKVISVGRYYNGRMSRSAHRIVIHEVYGHALRGDVGSVAESEGFAIFLEQLLASRFKFRRSYRYLAASLGWGTIASPMTFREVFEILWRVMVIMSNYKVELAKQYAFDECVRVFRGGRPEIAGAVYLKDSVYFSANAAMWKQLSEHRLSYNDFIDVIEGRRKILP